MLIDAMMIIVFGLVWIGIVNINVEERNNKDAWLTLLASSSF